MRDIVARRPRAAGAEYFEVAGPSRGAVLPAVRRPAGLATRREADLVAWAPVAAGPVVVRATRRRDRPPTRALVALAAGMVVSGVAGWLAAGALWPLMQWAGMVLSGLIALVSPVSLVLLAVRHRCSGAHCGGCRG
jgi:hypothetical protein